MVDNRKTIVFLAKMLFFKYLPKPAIAIQISKKLKSNNLCDWSKNMVTGNPWLCRKNVSHEK